MTLYRDEIARLNKTLYPHDDLTRQIRDAKLYIDKHFSENINLDKIASQALVSKFHFIRLFKNYRDRFFHFNIQSSFPKSECQARFINIFQHSWSYGFVDIESFIKNKFYYFLILHKGPNGSEIMLFSL